MQFRTRMFVLFLLIMAASGCSKVVIRSDSDPNVDFSSLHVLYVRKLPADNRGIEKIIQSKLNEFGFQATSGAGLEPHGPVDAIVTYEDRWMWDITMYMLSIDIQFRDPETGYVLSSGSSYRTSLVRESPEEMVDEVFRDMFAGKIALPDTQDK